MNKPLGITLQSSVIAIITFVIFGFFPAVILTIAFTVGELFKNDN